LQAQWRAKVKGKQDGLMVVGWRECILNASTTGTFDVIKPRDISEEMQKYKARQIKLRGAFQRLLDSVQPSQDKKNNPNDEEGDISNEEATSDDGEDFIDAEEEIICNM